MLSRRWLALVAVLGSAYYGFSNYSIEGLQSLRLTPRGASSGGLGQTTPQDSLSVGDRLALLRSSSDGQTVFTSITTGTATEAPAIRIGSFNLHLFGSNKTNKPFVMECLAKIARKFEVLALQEISGSEQDLLPLLVQKINQSGRRYDYLIGPRVGRGNNKVQFAFLFDTDRIETDRFQLYTVDDPMDLIHTEPLVAWFRTRDVPTKEAFTFTAVNIQVDENQLENETRLLPELLDSIQRDGRNEDDCILLGDFGTGDRQMAFLRSSGIEFALQGVPTTPRGDVMLDNILFPAHATDEFTGRAGAMDFLREFNLSIDQALEVSDHMPVWAEFFSNEGGQHGRVAKSAFH